MKKILALHTGGTISMLANEKGHVASTQINPMTIVENPIDSIQVTSRDIFNIPSPHIQMKHMLLIYQMIKEEATNYDGFVITHGTDPSNSLTNFTKFSTVKP